ncbi:MAG: hypothetical protein WCH34_07290 [Bacteroidota bacterium]
MRKKRYIKYNVSEEDILDDIRKVANELGVRDFNFSKYDKFGKYGLRIINQKIGPWQKAKDLAGLIKLKRSKYSEKELLNDVKNVFELNGRKYLSKSKYLKLGKYKNSSIYKRLGDWNNVLIKADIDSNIDHYFSNEDIIEEIKRVAGIVGESSFNLSKLLKLSDIKLYLISKRFGNWKQACELAGIKRITKLDSIQECDFIEDLKRVANLDGKNYCSQSNYSKNGKYSTYAYLKRYGNWESALKAAGINTSKCISCTKEELIDDIKRVANGQICFTFNDYIKKGKYTAYQINRIIGSWSLVGKEVGFDVRINKKMATKEKMLEDIKKVAEILQNNMLKTVDYKKLGKYGVRTIITKFGTWNNAIEAAGLKPRLCIKHTNEELIEDILRVANGRPNLSMTEYKIKGRHHYSNFNTHFGSWMKAKTLVGLTSNPRGRRITKEEAIVDLKRVSELINNEYLKPYRYQYLGNYHYATILNKFGTWENALTQAGLEVIKIEYSKEKLGEDILKVANGRIRLTLEEYKKEGIYTYHQILKLFGSWGKASKATGLNKKMMDETTSNEIFEDMRSVAQKLSKENITIKNYVEHGKYNFSKIVKIFGRWKIALKKAGFNEWKLKKYSKEELLDDLIRVKEGKSSIMFTDYKKKGRFKYVCYYRGFGNWKNALNAANLKANNLPYED